MESVTHFSRRHFFSVLAFFGFLLFACNVNQQEEEQKFSFPGLADSLSQYDSTVITLRDASGNTVDTLFHGEITKDTKLTGLDAPHYKGGAITIVMESYKDKKIVNLVQKDYNGSTIRGTVLNLGLNDSLAFGEGKYDTLEVDLFRKDGSTLLNDAFRGRYEKNPQGLLKDIPLGVDPPSEYKIVLTAYKDGVKKLQLGFSVSSFSVSQPVILFNISGPIPPGVDSLWVVLSPRSLSLIENGPSDTLSAVVNPSGAPTTVTWLSLDPTVATVDAGIVRPLKSGETKILARPAAGGKADTIPVLVQKATEKPPVTGIRISPRSLILADNEFAGQTLESQLLPLGAMEEVLWFSADSGIAKVSKTGLVTPGSEGEAHIIAQVKTRLDLRDSVLVKVVVPPRNVQSISLNPKTAILYLGNGTKKIGVSILPENPKNLAVFSSTDSSIAAVASDGTINPKREGSASILAYPAGFPGLRDSCSVTVKKDVPSIDAGSSRKAAVMAEVTFTIVVKQEAGTVAMLRWDLDGNGIWEDTAVADTATARFKYPKSGSFTAQFQVRDSEGNENSQSVTVVVGGNAPLVEIKNPSKDTLVNTKSFLVAYEVNGVGFTKPYALKYGPNPIVITEINAGEIGGDSLYITLDTVPPVVKITSPTAGFLTNKSNVPVSWSIDGADQVAGQNSEILAGKQGDIAILREAFDSAGNRGTATVIIRRDTIAPAAPVFDDAATTPSPSNSKRPKWVWKGAADGSGDFKYKFDTQTEVETRIKEFTPESELTDGAHTLVVYERDAATNWSLAATRILTVKTSGPGAPTVIGNRSSVNAPSWTWTGSGRSGARFTVVLTKVGEAGNKDSLIHTALNYLPGNGIVFSSGKWKLRVREEDSLGNWGSYGEGDVDLTRPGKPAFDLSKTSLKDHNSLNLKWTWTTASNGGGGYELSVNGGPTFASSQLTYELIGEEGKAYTLSVRAIDGAKIKGDTIQSHAIKVDVTPPSLTFTTAMQSQLTTGNPSISCIALDPNGGSGVASVTYNASGAFPISGSAILSGGNWTLNSASFPVGFTTVTFTVTDKAGLSSSKEFTLIKNLVFIKEGSTGNGKSWETAFGSFEDALEGTQLSVYPSGTQIWVTGGQYLRQETISDVYLKSGLRIYGGFSSINPEKSIQSRTQNYTTNLKSNQVDILSVRTPASTGINDVKVDGITFKCEGCLFQGVGIIGSTDIEFSNCVFMSTGGEKMVSNYNSQVNYLNCDFSNSEFVGELLSIRGEIEGPRKLTTLTGCSFTFNNVYNVLTVSNANANFTSCSLRNNTNAGGYLNYGFGSADVNFTSSVLEGWNASPRTIRVSSEAKLFIDGVKIEADP